SAGGGGEPGRGGVGFWGGKREGEGDHKKKKKVSSFFCLKKKKKKGFLMIYRSKKKIRKKDNKKKNTTNPHDPPHEYDVAIVGGGLAGLTLALQLKKARPATSILVIEKQKHPVPEAAHKVGESTVEIGARYLRDILGLREHLETQQLIKYSLRFFFS